jgi:DNA polymerase I-like protein with 3'-5' exonuclease and polymerase domains
VLARLDQELEGFSDQSIELEHAVARIINQQTNNGWQLDEEAVYMLLAELKEKKFDLEQEVHKRFKPHYKKDREVHPRYKKDGSLSTVGIRYLGDDCYDLVGGVHTRVDCVPFNLASRKQIGEYLISFGWVPTKFTKTGQPVVSEEELRWVKGIPEASLIADYLTVNQRIGMAQGWLEKVTEEGRVHGYVNSNGAVTGRMTHSDPNVAQVTARGKPYGAEMRACWIVPRGYKLVGMDASGLELRMLAHYMNDDDYIKTVCEGRQEDGTDVHTTNQRAAGLGTRDQAKTFIYAFLYGAGDAKIGSITGDGRAEGKRLKEKFLSGLPALKSLQDRVERAAAKGYLTGLDGRRIAVRSSHAALNTLLQGAGAVVMKQALVNLDRMARAHGLDYKLVGNIHDEVQAEVAEGDAEKFGKLAVYAVAKAGQDLNLRCPLAAEYKVGDNWAETH